ncbi:protein FAR1-RELATED SEQUENCE 5-like [Apium graveolens]|uniref:protein FAR1-RELATED SEQUENCE 5-like n=1 Tax=Apium graveolens TaxID=4045 RepID=UPI003D793A63
MTAFQRHFLLDAVKSNMGAFRAPTMYKSLFGLYSDVGPTAMDFQNWMRDIKLYIGKHDADMLLQKFKNKHETSDGGFFYEFQTDSNGHLTRLFWADLRGRKNYEVFGDVVSFDATYRTKYGMVFVPFIGIDNHWKSCTFSSTLLYSENESNFTWSCEMLLKVFPLPPKCIITDQCPAMKVAISKIFSSSVHRFCMWHIMQKFPAKVYSASIKSCRWNSVLNESWIPAFFRDKPMGALLRTTSRSESTNFHFNHFIQKGDTLSEFYMCYESAIDKQIHEIKKLNDEDTCVPQCVTEKQIEKHAAHQYTRTIFYKNEVNCSCKLFTRVGYLCRHYFYMLGLWGVERIPHQYLSTRWMRNAEKRFSKLKFENEIENINGAIIRDTSKKIWTDFQGCFGSVSNDIGGLNFMLEGMRSLKISIDDKFQSRDVPKDDILQECFGVRPSGSSTVLPLIQTNNKGSRKRIASAAELSRDGKKRKLRICKTCNTKEYHDSRKCPTKSIHHQKNSSLQNAQIVLNQGNVIVTAGPRFGMD